METVEKCNLDADIETEETSSSDGVIIHPFKPNEIEIETPPFSVGYLMDRIEHEEINMNTDFQREGNLWSDVKQSRLIESILLGLPLPAFYFDTFSPAWDIIDGLQRCCSIQNFCIKKTLRLTGLEYLDMDGMGFDDLDRTLQRSIIMKPITVNLLKKSPRNVRYILFKRLNTAGLVLTPQEIRNAIYHGSATEKLDILAKILQAFIAAADGRIPSNRMQDKDFVCRFVAFYLTAYSKYTPDLESFLNSAMELLANENIEPIKENFTKALRLAIDIFRTDAFRKRTYTDAQRRPINKAYFEVITVHFSRLNSHEEDLLRQNKEILKANLMELMRSKRYDGSLRATGTKDSVTIRFSWFEAVLKKSIQGIRVRITHDNKIEDIEL